MHNLHFTYMLPKTLKVPFWFTFPPAEGEGTISSTCSIQYDWTFNIFQLNGLKIMAKYWLYFLFPLLFVSLTIFTGFLAITVFFYHIHCLFFYHIICILLPVCKNPTCSLHSNLLHTIYVTNKSCVLMLKLVIYS